MLYFTQVDSTMTVLRGEPGDGKIVVAAEQTRGRGRTSGRRWISGPGESLLFSLALLKRRISVPPTSLPARTALAIAEMLRGTFGLPAVIKWPNDVLVGERKIAGILGESRDDYIFLGVGINCRQRSFEEDLRRPATSIRLETGREADPLDLLGDLLPRMESLFFHVSKDEFPRLIGSRLFRIGESFEILEGPPGKSKRIGGILKGLGPEGELRLLQKNGKILTIYSGE